MEYLSPTDHFLSLQSFLPYHVNPYLSIPDTVFTLSNFLALHQMVKLECRTNQPSHNYIASHSEKSNRKYLK